MPTDVLELAMWAVMWARRDAGFELVVEGEEKLGGEVGSDGDMAGRGGVGAPVTA